ncbi:MAG: transglycosylase [Hyphomonas sp.]|uniref:murein transglycosylase A n=1 Tax=Hyphomonas sp. TaxID=87 RepID=UPI0025BD3C8B|nr:MltA domain-containing protein [Hyphomonas sp.]MBA4339063.1 transglycosylase [Hyphomonas sp.]
MRHLRFLLPLALILSACQTAPAPIEHRPVPGGSGISGSPPSANPATYLELPGWGAAPLAAPVEAFRRTCDRFNRRAVDAALSRGAPWAGTAGDWQPGCAALESAQGEAAARKIFETQFVPLEIIDREGKDKFTGYFEPRYEARRAPEGVFTEPVFSVPSDFVANGDSPLQKLPDGSTRPYPARADITARGGPAIAYAHPADVFFLQVQGSGRLTFPDGSTMRAAYAAHNGQPFKSVANWLIETGRITRAEGSMQGIRGWMDRASAAEVREAMNINPRFVFFQSLPEGDPNLGPNGAHNVPLTPLGSMAVDPEFHALGVPMFVQTTAPGLGGEWSGLLIAQDTGGAIKGPVRGDIYFGTGVDAGNRAGTMNAKGRLWVLLPRAVVERMFEAGLVASIDSPGQTGG